ncbi:MAG: signal recognition particle protein [Thermodesulfobacteriota bacterium]
MFESLSDRLSATFRKLKGQGRLTEKNIEEGLKEVRLALLEADVHYKVVKSLIASIKERAVGQEVMESLTPGQQVVKIVHEELKRLMGDGHTDVDLSGPAPAAVMLVGLQGSGKTTTAGKLARHLRSQGRKVYLVPADVARPAAIDQLVKIAGEINVPVYPTKPGDDPVEVARAARMEAAKNGLDTVIVDTAGRLHIDDALMDELGRIKAAVSPSDILFVADAMTGQDAVNQAQSFHQALGLGGVILTKMDGDARGGAALSVRSVTGTPIKFVGVGEKLSAFEPFHPDRMANRVLGMGDVLTLIEKAQSAIDEKKAVELTKKLRKNQFTLEDFRDQLTQVRKMGSIEEILSMIPGFSRNKHMKGLSVDEKEFVRIEAIIGSMTKKERANHQLINGSRKKRIASGSGTSVQDVNRLLKNYTQVMKVMKHINKGGMKGLGRLFS